MAESICHKCGKPVPKSQEKGYFLSYFYNQPGLVFLTRAQHILPTDDCDGSPSLAQYLPGQKPDERKDAQGNLLYPMVPESAERVRAIWDMMQTEVCFGDGG